MSKRINVILPEETLKVLDRVAPKGDRSRFISQAVLYYVESVGRRSLKAQLKAGYETNADRSREIAREWFPLEDEAWSKASN